MKSGILGIQISITNFFVVKYNCYYIKKSIIFFKFFIFVKYLFPVYNKKK